MAIIRSNRNNQNQTDDWKASGFLNLYLPSKDGKQRKVGAIALKGERGKALAEFLGSGPENLAKFVSKLTIDYQSAEPSEGGQFDL